MERDRTARMESGGQAPRFQGNPQPQVPNGYQQGNWQGYNSQAPSSYPQYPQGGWQQQQQWPVSQGVQGDAPQWNQQQEQPTIGQDQSSGQGFAAMMPQPNYVNGYPQPIRQPVAGSSAMACFFGSRSLKTGVSSILWLLLGWIVIIGPIIAIVQGIRAIFRGIIELIGARYVGTFGVLAAICGIVLGLIGGGVPTVGTFMLCRAGYIVEQAEMNGQEVIIDDPEDSWNLLLHGKARFVDRGDDYGTGNDYGTSDEDVDWDSDYSYDSEDQSS